MALICYMMLQKTGDSVPRCAQAPTGAGALPTCSPTAGARGGAASGRVACAPPRRPGRTASTGQTSPAGWTERAPRALAGTPRKSLVEGRKLSKRSENQGIFRIFPYFPKHVQRNPVCIEHLRVKGAGTSKSSHWASKLGPLFMICQIHSSWMATWDKRLGAANQCR